MSDVDQVIDMGDRYNAHRQLRVWKPGDGLTCAFASRASRNRPCGPPVAVRIGTSLHRSGNGKQRREVVCAYHLSVEFGPGDLSAEAENAAREKVIVAHWDEYLAAVREFMEPLVERMIGDLPQELKLLVLEGLARHEQAADGEGES